MPKAPPKKKPVSPVAPTPPTPAVAEPTVVNGAPSLPIIYPKLLIEEYSINSTKGPIDVEWAKIALGWETETQYLERKLKQNPGSTAKEWMANPDKEEVFGDIYHCKNLAGEKVRCNNNAQNRSFDEDWSDAIRDMILYGQWAGPFTIPGETVNGETIRISKYGEVLSAQHQLTGLIKAGEKLEAARRDKTDTKYPVWKDKPGPFIETIVIKGLSSDERVLMTIDYVKPRTVADVFYTSGTFRERATLPVERKELCRLLAQASDTLWVRTDTKGYKTHPEVVAFLERHRRLLRCVEHIFKVNSAASRRRLSKLRLTPGHCAAVMFLQACSGPKTEGDFYRNESPPSEKNLDWSLWDRAEEFWTRLASPADKDFEIVRDVLMHLIDSTPTNEINQGMGGRGPEKLAVVCNAWSRWKDHEGDGPVFDKGDFKAPEGELALVYVDYDSKGKKLPPGEVDLLNPADFLGIDCPDAVTKNGDKASGRGEEPEPPAPAEADILELAEQARLRRQSASK